MQEKNQNYQQKRKKYVSFIKTQKIKKRKNYFCFLFLKKPLEPAIEHFKIINTPPRFFKNLYINLLPEVVYKHVSFCKEKIKNKHF